MNRVKVKSRMKDRFLIALAPVLLASTLAIGVIGLATPAGAVTMTTETTVTLLRTGWDADSFAVVTAAPIINPAHCATPDGYITAKSFPVTRHIIGQRSRHLSTPTTIYLMSPSP